MTPNYGRPSAVVPWVFPIGTLDLGMVDPFEVYKARVANQIPEPNALIPLTRTATDDEILGAFHGFPLPPQHQWEPEIQLAPFPRRP